MIADGAEDEDKWLAAGIAGLKQNAFYMQRAMDSNNLRDALKYSAQMLSELRTSKLSPHKYYELYMRAFDELRKHAGNILHETCVIPLRNRVVRAGAACWYLLCTVGSVCIKFKEAPARDILKDLVEMCRGVQHPLRGLFLRSYLAQVSRDKLPDIGSEYEGDADTLADALEFVLQNFTEMTKLWVRMQHQRPNREKERREKERSELRDLVITVGKNLHVLSQLEGVDLEMYRDNVLPRVLEQVVNCKDELAQSYLMDCIIQVFPDEYHLQTLDVLLGACPQLQPSVDIKTVLSCLMERLSNFAASNVEVLPDFLQVEAFSKLNDAIGKVIEAQVDMPILGVVTLHSFLLKFALHVHPDQLDYADQVLGSCVGQLLARGKLQDNQATKQIVALLSAPLEKYNDVVTVLKLANYPRVMEYLDYETNKVMATVIIQSIMKNNTRISTADEGDALFELIKGLIKDLDGTSDDEVDEDDFEEGQSSVARLVQMLYKNDPEVMFKIISTVRKHILTGEPKCLPFTVPSLVFAALRLIRRLQCEDENPFGDEASAAPKRILQLLNETIKVLSNVSASDLALRLYLQCAEAANDCDLEPVAYEFFTQAFLLYEEEISYSAKLLKKPDQCRAVYKCAHLFWVDNQEDLKDGERVLLCLKRALRIANAAQQMANAARGSTGSVTLFIEILSKNPQLTADAIQSLIELIKAEMQRETTRPDPAADLFLSSTLRYLDFLKQKGGAISKKYEQIKV